MSTSAFPTPCFAGFFEEFPSTHFLFHTAMFYQFPKTTNRLLNRLILTQTQSNHSILHTALMAEYETF